MKLITLLLALFLIDVIIVMIAMIALNIDLFIWSAGIGDLIGFTIIFMQWQFNEELYKKIW
jgi:hypothetical protein